MEKIIITYCNENYNKNNNNNKIIIKLNMIMTNSYFEYILHILICNNCINAVVDLEWIFLIENMSDLLLQCHLPLYFAYNDIHTTSWILFLQYVRICTYYPGIYN